MIDQYIIIGLCLLIILSYLYNLIAQHLKIPSVLLLLATGVLCRWLSTYYGLNIKIPQPAISIFGSVGLILIVLEGMLDIKFARGKMHLLGSAFLVCIMLVTCSTAGIAWLIVSMLGVSWHNALLYALSLSVISSAIVIPTVERLSTRTKEFMLYESTLSDIIGILIFNIIAFNRPASGIGQYLNLAGQTLLTIIVSVIFSLVIIWLMIKIKTRVRFYLIIALIILIYESGNLLHLSSLFLIMFFGLVLNNIDLFDNYLLQSKKGFLKRMGGRMRDFMQDAYVTVDGFKPMVLETSFVIRTIFFFMFGYSININGIFQIETLAFCGYAIGIMYALRLINLQFFTRSSVFPEILIYPRGATTILLYYSIPAENRISELNGRMLFTIIIITNVLMMFGVLFSKKEEVKLN